MNHAIELTPRRADTLSDQWQQFAADDRARILVWRLDPSEQLVAHAFLSMEIDERTAEHPDRFLELDSAFTTAEGHSQRLCDELHRRYFERHRFRAHGMGTHWIAPIRNAEDSDIAHLVRSCSVFAAHQALPRHLVLALQPLETYDDEAYRGWLIQLSRSLPSSVRLLAFDRAGQPEWTLGEADAERIVVRAAMLDLTEAYTGNCRSSSRRETPGDRFRELYLGLIAALETRDLPRALRLGVRALAISDPHDWLDLSVPIHSRLGTSLALEGRVEEAKAHFLAAEACALRGESELGPDLRSTCMTLRLQSRIGLGSALILGQCHAEAARLFEATSSIAADYGDDAARLDCYRLAAFSHERAGAADAGFRCAYEGFQLAKQMPPRVRAAAALPCLAATLFWLCDKTGRAALRAELERELDSMTVGELEGGPPPP